MRALSALDDMLGLCLGLCEAAVLVLGFGGSFLAEVDPLDIKVYIFEDILSIFDDATFCLIRFQDLRK